MYKEPEFISTVKAAQLLRVSPNTLAIWRCYKTVNLPFYKTENGRRIVYRRSDVEAFAEERKKKLEG